MLPFTTKATRQAFMQHHHNLLRALISQALIRIQAVLRVQEVQVSTYFWPMKATMRKIKTRALCQHLHLHQLILFPHLQSHLFNVHQQLSIHKQTASPATLSSVSGNGPPQAVKRLRMLYAKLMKLKENCTRNRTASDMQWGYCSKTKTWRSMRWLTPWIFLKTKQQPQSIADWMGTSEKSGWRKKCRKCLRTRWEKLEAFNADL